MPSAFRSTVYVRIRRRWLGVRVITWSGKVHVWEGAAEAILVSGKKGQIEAFSASEALPRWSVLSRQFTAFAHPRVLIEGYTETTGVIRAWLRQSGWKHKAGTSMVIHVLDHWEGGLSELELRALQQMAKELGASQSAVIEGGAELTDPEILRFARTKGLPLPYRPVEVVPSLE